MRYRLLVGMALAVPLVFFFFTLAETREWVGAPFSGYLVYENGVVGPFYVPGWVGAENGVLFNHISPKASWPHQIFDKLDFILVVLLPLASGLVFILLGVLASPFLPEPRSREVFVLFHLLAGLYQILSVDFQTTHRFSPVLMVCWVFMPAAMIHFAWLFPKRRWPSGSWKMKGPYLAAAGMLGPYIYFFQKDPEFWVGLQSFWAFVVAAAYIYWMAELVRQKNRPEDSFTRILATYVFWGQLAAFSLPLLAFVFLFILKVPFPLNLATPVTFLFPASCFVGVMLARLKQGQRELIVAEKRALAGRLFSGLAHELKNPLTFVYSNVEPLTEMIRGLDQGPPSKDRVDEMKAALRDIETGAERAVRLLQDFKVLATGETRDESSVDLNKSVGQAIHLMRHEAAGLVEFQTELAEIPDIRANENEILRILINLMTNAREAMPGGGRVRVSTSYEAGEIRLAVSDEGPGISPGDLEKIFEPFYSTKEQGMGLGLSLVRELARKNGGEIRVDSAPGRGTRFELRWRAVKASS